MSVVQPVTMRRKRCRNIRKSKYCYESPLNVFKKSLEELTSIVGDIVHDDGRLTRGKLRKLNEQNATSSRESPSRNSIIVINDSDSDTADEVNDNQTNKGDGNDTSLSVIKCIPKLSPSQQQKKSKISSKQNNRLSVTPDDSIIYLSDMQEESLLNGENIAPTQTEDDVVELWSCLKKSNKRKKSARYSSNERTALFKIDKRPNMKYLKCLRTEYEEKRKKKQNRFHNKTTSKLVNQKTSEYLNNNHRKRWRDDNSDLSPTMLNGQPSKKRMNLGEKNKFNTIRKNSTPKLREIVVDGCNVAMAHTNGKVFSEKGIQLVVNYFESRGHIVKVFLPQHVRKKEHTYLEQLYKEGIVVFTPSRTIGGRQITSYDDRFILKYATSCGGIVISTDQYRDLYREKPEWRNTIEHRLLVPTFVGDYIMFPEDPLGRSGPNLETFLQY